MNTTLLENPTRRARSVTTIHPGALAHVGIGTPTDDCHVWLQAIDDCMCPTFSAGDWLRVNTQDKIIGAEGGVFAYTVGEVSHVRRLVRYPNGDLEVICDAPHWQRLVLTPDDQRSLQVIGRVVAVVAARPL
jgi:Peptidase S24-like